MEEERNASWEIVIMVVRMETLGFCYFDSLYFKGGCVNFFNVAPTKCIS